jgi:hypothetical protein
VLHLLVATRWHHCNALNLGVNFFSSLILTKFRRYSLFSSRFAPSSQFLSSIATGVRIACKQKPKLSWVLHHAEAYFFCLMSCSIACLSSLVSGFVLRLDSDQCLCVLWDFDPRPGLARPWPARPWRPCPPPCAPCISLTHSIFPRTTPSPHLSLSSPLCPRCSGDGYRRIWIPKVSSPPPSLFLFLPFPSLLAPPSSPLRVRAPGALACGPLTPRVAPRPPAAQPLVQPARLPAPPGTAPRHPRRRGSPGPLRAVPGARLLLRGPGAASCAPGSRNAIPRAQPHARGDQYLILVNFKHCLTPTRGSCRVAPARPRAPLACATRSRARTPRVR